MSRTPKHILVIRLSAMGDVAMTVPVIRQFSKQYPEVKLTILTREFFKPFFKDIENVSVHTADPKGIHKGILGLYRLSREMKPLNIDAIADLHNVLRSNILKRFLAKTKCVQIDKGRAEKKALTSGKAVKQLKTTHQRYADVFERLGYKLDLTKPEFPKKAKMNQNTARLIGNQNQELIGIAPFAAFEGKVYPLRLMEEVIKELTKSYTVLLFGGGNNETELLNNISNKYDNTINLAGKLTLDEELDVISNVSVMVSMDSGNAHIAAMLGIEVVTLWGVTHPYAGFYPFNQNKENAILADRNKFPLIPTSVYGNKYPKTYQNAIGSIKPKEIVAKVISTIQNKNTKN